MPTILSRDNLIPCSDLVKGLGIRLYANPFIVNCWHFPVLLSATKSSIRFIFVPMRWCLSAYTGVFLGKNFRGGGGQTNVSRNRGEHRLELKYIMYFVASASLAYSSCLILHSVCAN